MAGLSVSNFHKPRPRWFVKLQKIQVTSTTAVVAMVKAFWHGDDKGLNAILVIILTGIPMALEILGTMMADDDDQAAAPTQPNS